MRVPPVLRTTMAAVAALAALVLGSLALPEPPPEAPAASFDND